MTSFLLGFSICLNIIFIIIFILFNKEEDIIADKKVKKKGVKLYGKKESFSKEEFENIDHDFYDNDF